MNIKKLLVGGAASAILLGSMVVPISAAQGGKFAGCVTIPEGTLTYSAGHYLAGDPFTTGYDEFGYNYQASRFQGSYANVYLGGDGFPPYTGDDASYLAANPGAAAAWYWPYRDVNLILEWNGAWISNKDCDANGTLDRHFGYPTYVGSGAWETNHMWGVNPDGSKWNYFVKIVAVPSDATKVGGVWYTSNGDEISPDIWGEFAIIQEVYNDPSTGDHGLLYGSPVGPGFGKY